MLLYSNMHPGTQPTTATPDPQAAVWRALADPTRRLILDHLRRAPMTTGDLVEALPHGRCAVMKHLGVLTDAALVTVQRD